MKPLLLPGLLLLALSLLLAVALPSIAASSPDAPGAVSVLAWSSQATLYVGSGLVVAAAVLRALRPTPTPPPPLDWFAEQ